MIIAFETKDSDVLSKYLHYLEKPEDMPISFRSILLNFSYNLWFDRKVYRIDDLVIIIRHGVLETLVRIIIFINILLLLFFLFMSWYTALYISVFTILGLLALISPKFYLYATIWRLKFYDGHNFKITIPSMDYVLQKVLYKYESK